MATTNNYPGDRSADDLTLPLRAICSAYCAQYQSEARFFIQDRHPSGLRRLVVRYERSGKDGRREFAAAIPPDWREQEIHNLILWPKNAANSEWPAWEVPARTYNSPTLFRYWAGEKPAG